MAKIEEYYIHRIDDKTCRMTKAINGDIIPSSVYVVGDSSCQCYQSNRGQCRHMVMRKAWILRKISPQSAIFNYAADTCTPMESAE